MDYRDNRQRWAESHQVVHFYAGQWCTFTPALTEIGETLSRLRADRGLAIVLVEQNLDFVASLADRALILQRGRFTREASAQDLADSAKMEGLLGMT